MVRTIELWFVIRVIMSGDGGDPYFIRGKRKRARDTRDVLIGTSDVPANRDTEWLITSFDEIIFTSCITSLGMTEGMTTNDSNDQLSERVSKQ